MKKFRCYKAKIEESEMASSRLESNPGHLWLEPPVLCHWAMATGQPRTLTILYIYCTDGTECLRHTPGSQSVCAVRTLLQVDQKFSPLGKNPCWVVISLQMLRASCLMLEIKKFRCYEAKIEPHNISSFIKLVLLWDAFRVHVEPQCY